MTVGDLKVILEGLDDAIDVQLMTQENYPLVAHAHGAVTDIDIAMEVSMNAEEPFVIEPPEPKVLYIVEGRQCGYGKREAWTAERCPF